MWTERWQVTTKVGPNEYNRYELCGSETGTDEEIELFLGLVIARSIVFKSHKITKRNAVYHARRMHLCKWVCLQEVEPTCMKFISDKTVIAYYPFVMDGEVMGKWAVEGTMEEIDSICKVSVEKKRCI